jgi:hypothetical protein
MDKEGFLLEIPRLAFEMERVIEKYGVRDEVLSLMVTGLVEEDEEDPEENLNFVEETFIPSDKGDEGPDLDDLLSGLGISLN